MVRSIMKKLTLEAIFSFKNEAVLEMNGFYIGVFGIELKTPIWEIGVAGLWYKQTTDERFIEELFNALTA